MMDVVSEDDLAGKTLRIRVLPEFFPGSWKHACGARAQRLRWFDYGYALTVHKAQGSQWDDVILFDESYAFREHRARWLYTGITAYLEAGGRWKTPGHGGARKPAHNKALWDRTGEEITLDEVERIGACSEKFRSSWGRPRRSADRHASASRQCALGHRPNGSIS
jgi:UvrD-like helicase C-terminal domain